MIKEELLKQDFEYQALLKSEKRNKIKMISLLVGHALSWIGIVGGIYAFGTNLNNFSDKRNELLNETGYYQYNRAYKNEQTQKFYNQYKEGEISYSQYQAKTSNIQDASIDGYISTYGTSEQQDYYNNLILKCERTYKISSAVAIAGFCAMYLTFFYGTSAEKEYQKYRALRQEHETNYDFFEQDKYGFIHEKSTSHIDENDEFYNIFLDDYFGDKESNKNKNQPIDENKNE